MLRSLKDERAQAVLGEYVLVFLIVAGMVTAMTVYFKRTVQGKIRDARNFAVRNVFQITNGVYTGNLYLEYEPYYTNTVSLISRDSTQEVSIIPDNAMGYFRKTMNDVTSIDTYSVVSPPKDFNATH